MNIKTITAFDRNDFQKWLVKHHKKETKVGVILHKRHTGKSAPTHRELMEEAICFGWIDTTVKRIDEDKYMRRFSKRNNNSKWSDNTLSYAKELVKKKKMTLEGLKYYHEGLKKPTHDAHVPKNPDMPERDRLILSNGHITPIRYVLMAMSGYFPIEELKTLRKFKTRLQGHPERERLPGVETTSGPLGSGLGQAAGYARPR